MPVDYRGGHRASPVFNYPYARTREALEKMRRLDEWDPCHGLKLRYVNPVDGGYAIPTMATFMQLLPNGFESARCRATDGTVFCVVEGSGRSKVGDAEFEWGPHDVFVAPS